MRTIELCCAEKCYSTNELNYYIPGGRAPRPPLPRYYDSVTDASKKASTGSFSSDHARSSAVRRSQNHLSHNEYPASWKRAHPTHNTPLDCKTWSNWLCIFFWLKYTLQPKRSACIYYSLPRWPMARVCLPSVGHGLPAKNIFKCSVTQILSEGLLSHSPDHIPP